MIIMQLLLPVRRACAGDTINITQLEAVFCFFSAYLDDIYAPQHVLLYHTYSN
jgi:hypothetical protein